MPQAELTKFRGRCKVVLIGVKPNTQRELRPFVSRCFPLSTQVDLPSSASIPELSAALDGAVPKFCFAEVADLHDPLVQLIPEMLRFDPKLHVVCLLPSKEPDLVLRCLRAGATDFLLPPLHADQWDAVVQKFIKVTPLGLDATPGKIYCVMPAKGACGATTVACGLAYEWKRLGLKRILLADLDPLTGVISFLLKVNANHSFANVLQRAADMDPDLWKAMVVNRDGVDILVAPETALDGPLNLTDAAPILDYARFHYDVVVADAGYSHGAWSLSQALLSDEVLLVTTNELTALQATQRALYDLESKGVGRWKIRLVINRYDPHVGLSRDKIARALHMDVCHVLPSDYPAMQRALLEGRPVPVSSRFGKSIAGLAKALADPQAERRKEHRKAPLLAGIRSLFNRA